MQSGILLHQLVPLLFGFPKDLCQCFSVSKKICANVFLFPKRFVPMFFLFPKDLYQCFFCFQKTSTNVFSVFFRLWAKCCCAALIHVETYVRERACSRSACVSACNKPVGLCPRTGGFSCFCQSPATFLQPKPSDIPPAKAQQHSSNQSFSGRCPKFPPSVTFCLSAAVLNCRNNVENRETRNKSC